jgi:hypothetical protein
MDLSVFTKRVEECRRRWNRDTLRYVVEIARVVRKARKAAGNHRRWCRWIRAELHMDRSTIHRYLKVEAFLSRNVASTQHFEKLTIAKIHALSRLEPERASRLLANKRIHRMGDRAFMELLRRWDPRTRRHPSAKNLLSSMNAALCRIETSMKRWNDSELTLSSVDRSRLQTRLLAAERALHRISRSAAAM